MSLTPKLLHNKKVLRVELRTEDILDINHDVEGTFITRLATLIPKVAGKYKITIEREKQWNEY